MSLPNVSMYCHVFCNSSTLITPARTLFPFLFGLCPSGGLFCFPVPSKGFPCGVSFGRFAVRKIKGKRNVARGVPLGRRPTLWFSLAWTPRTPCAGYLPLHGKTIWPPDGAELERGICYWKIRSFFWLFAGKALPLQPIIIQCPFLMDHCSKSSLPGVPVTGIVRTVFSKKGFSAPSCREIWRAFWYHTC